MKLTRSLLAATLMVIAIALAHLTYLSLITSQWLETKARQLARIPR